MSKDISTLEKIIQCSKQEFLEKGYKDASLRGIAAAAGLTTGAIYGHFKDKNAIFEAIVNPVCEQVEEIFMELSKNYYDAGGFVSEINVEESIEELRQIYKYVYNHFDEFRLLIVCAEGSSRAEFMHTLVEYEVEHTMAYLKQIKQVNNVEFDIDEETLHILSDSYIGALMEPVRHNMSYHDAIKKVEFLGVFFAEGWKAVIKSLLGGEV